MRTFQPREYQGRPVVIRLLKHPATGELLMPAGTTLRGFDDAQWTAVPPAIPTARAASGWAAATTSA